MSGILSGAKQCEAQISLVAEMKRVQENVPEASDVLIQEPDMRFIELERSLAQLRRMLDSSKKKKAWRSIYCMERNVLSVGKENERMREHFGACSVCFNLGKLFLFNDARRCATERSGIFSFCNLGESLVAGYVLRPGVPEVGLGKSQA